MTKSELIEKITTQFPQFSRKDTEVIVKTIFATLTEALKKDERIEIRGFGSFHIRVRRARDGRNPKSGQVAHIPEKKVPFFKVGKTLKERVNIPSPSPQTQQSAPPQQQELTKTEEKT